MQQVPQETSRVDFNQKKGKIQQYSKLHLNKNIHFNSEVHPGSIHGVQEKYERKDCDVVEAYMGIFCLTRQGHKIYAYQHVFYC